MKEMRDIAVELTELQLTNVETSETSNYLNYFVKPYQELPLGSKEYFELHHLSIS
jgi:hypothetical protein